MRFALIPFLIGILDFVLNRVGTIFANLISKNVLVIFLLLYNGITLRPNTSTNDKFFFSGYVYQIQKSFNRTLLYAYHSCLKAVDIFIRHYMLMYILYAYYSCLKAVDIFIKHYMLMYLLYLLVLIFNIICVNLEINTMFDFMNQNNGLQNNNDFGSWPSHNPSSHNNGSGPQLPQNNNNQFLHHTQDDQDSSNQPIPEYNEQAAREYILRRLEDHHRYCRINRLSSTNKLDYAPLSKKFTTGEHEFICEKVANYYRVNPVPSGGLSKYVLGYSPDRHYSGPVGRKLKEIIANSGD